MAQQPDTITIDKAYELDLAWENGNQPDNALRCVSYRKAGNGVMTLLCIPGDDSAPTYQRVNGHYQHIAGPTLAEWQAQRDAAKIEDEYRQRQEAFNAAQEAQRDEWEALKAEKRAKRAARQLHKRDAAELEAALMASLSNEMQKEFAAQLDAAQQQAQRDAAELEAILEAEYRDEMDTRRSACDWAVQ